MNEEYKFGEAIPAKDGKRWSDDPEVYALIVENERLRRDAKRYRWLRDMIYDDRVIVSADRMLNGEALDVAVDAALQEQPR